MAPQASNNAAMASTTNLLFSAKSTRARIISCVPSRFSRPAVRSNLQAPGCPSLGKHMVKDQGVGNHFLARFQPRLDLLQTRVVSQEISTDNLQAAKLLIRRGNENKIAIVHMQNGGCRNNRVHLFGLTAESCLREHADPQHSWILDFDANLGGANARVEDRANVADRSLEHPLGIGIQDDLCGVPQPDIRQVVLVNVAD